MSERPLFFPGSSGKLFGVLHDPGSTAGRGGFVLCAPGFEEKLWAHRVLVNAARELAACGYTVLRFDYAGHGDSDGTFEDGTVESRLEDIMAATRYLRETSGVDAIHLLGLRFGATLAALAAERDPDAFRSLVLWAPIARGGTHMQELLRINLATQMAVYKEIRTNRKAMAEAMEAGELVNVDGYGLSGAMFGQASAIDLLANPSRFNGPVLIAGVVRREGMPNKEAEQLAGQYRSVTCRTIIEEPFWKEIKPYIPRSNGLVEATREWLQVDTP
ncbi:MAG: alpha/beta fold hydrolase [Acidobacteria bacterium]|uniref:Alpha/beta fold hydrolase n=1 Tax=Candidatus Polarisedimenticola svalbardensis TaxID=2886004 RepID=A0A8J7CF02_9BACT|nr:alpha/beta fold hydrolase [Candidatus Polarisedimenticola svalbardensis]